MGLEPPQRTMPVLYSFRRCPYAIRARMALRYTQIQVELREVVLRDKPRHLSEISPKATVPVLWLPDDAVIDESLDIMLWALAQRDPDGWLPEENGLRETVFSRIEDNDGAFKSELDRYKYTPSDPSDARLFHRQNAEKHLIVWEQQLSEHAYLLGSQMTLTDVAIAPFVRQFAHVDKAWFDQAPYPHTRRWLDGILRSDLFVSCMDKKPAWKPGDAPTLFPWPNAGPVTGD